MQISKEVRMERLNNISDLLNKGKTDEAIEMAQSFLKEHDKTDDQVYYLLGNAYRKKGDWQNAINNYLEAMERNPKGPATQAYRMAMDILDFFNKDMYNQ